MAKSNRGPEPEAVAVAAFCTAALVGTITLLYGLGLLNGREAERREQTPASYSKGAKADAERACARGESGAMFECVYERVESSSEQANTEQDLRAQQRAATSGLVSAVMAFLTFIVTSIGVWFVGRTLAATLNAVKETRDATTAMKKSNQIAEQQQRPWLDIAIDYDPTKIYYGKDDVRAIINVIATNHGERPCIVMNVDFRLVVNDMAGYKFKRSIPETVLDFASNIDIKPEYLDLIIHKKEQRYEGICDLVTESSSFIWLSAVVRVLYRDPATSKIHFTIRTFTFDSAEWNYNSPYIKMMSAEGGSLPVEGSVIYPQGSYAT